MTMHEADTEMGAGEMDGGTHPTCFVLEMKGA